MFNCDFNCDFNDCLSSGDVCSDVLYFINIDKVACNYIGAVSLMPKVIFNDEKTINFLDLCDRFIWSVPDPEFPEQ